MGTSLSSLQEQFVVCTCLQDTRNIFFNPEFEANLIKQLPQILPPLPSASLACLEQHENTSWKTQLPPTSAVPQASEIDIHPSMETTETCPETSCAISAVMQESAIAVPVESELPPSQGIRKLQLSLKDIETEALPDFSSVQWLVSNSCEALTKDSFPPAEGLICLQDLAFKQTKINAGASPDGPLMFMGGAAFATAVQQGIMTTPLTPAAEVSINAFQSANQTACLTPFLAGLKEAAATSVSPPVQPKLHYVPANWDPGPDFFDIMDWGTKAALQAFDVSYKEGEKEENLRGVTATHQHEACFELLFLCANPVWVKNPTQPDMAVIQITKECLPPGQ